jgi:hypothetical protein
MKFNVSLKGILKMSLVSRSGTSIAAAAATLILTGLALAPACTRRKAKGVVSVLMPAKAKGCGSASNNCVGQNACKGKGFLPMTQEDCDKIEGATFEPEKG